MSTVELHEDELRRAVKANLDGVFPNVSFNEFGTVMVSLPENPVGCKTARLPDGSLVVNLEAPVLLDVPSPSTEFYEMVCLLSHDIGYGSFMVIGAATGDIHLFVRAQVLAEALPGLGRAVGLVYAASVREIQRFRSITPPIGGMTAYGGAS